MVSPVQYFKSAHALRRGGWGEIVFAGLATVAVAVIGSYVTQQATDSNWYNALAKPSLMPPSFLFGIAWTTLYALMVISYGVVRHHADRHDFDFQAIFSVNLLVNLAWTLVFFGQRSPLGGLLVIVSYLAIVIAMAAIFAKYSRLAGWLCVPLCLWVAFATYLNASIFMLNQ